MYALVSTDTADLLLVLLTNKPAKNAGTQYTSPPETTELPVISSIV